MEARKTKGFKKRSEETKKTGFKSKRKFWWEGKTKGGLRKKN